VPLVGIFSFVYGASKIQIFSKQEVKSSENGKSLKVLFLYFYFFLVYTKRGKKKTNGKRCTTIKTN
jgi:hypothetical protein